MICTKRGVQRKRVGYQARNPQPKGAEAKRKEKGRILNYGMVDSNRKVQFFNTDVVNEFVDITRKSSWFTNEAARLVD